MKTNIETETLVVENYKTTTESLEESTYPTDIKAIPSDKFPSSDSSADGRAVSEQTKKLRIFGNLPGYTLAVSYLLATGIAVAPENLSYRIDQSTTAILKKNEDLQYIHKLINHSEKQPNLDHNQVMAYAEAMGLPTRFPL